ncbi:reverse transcriptase domain-containing protein [Aeromonas sp. A600620]|uniref:reverse transcriptase domain-containing protein n=1 Tax=Aeromonas sp. A600620 TaxID=2712059 RepID=UPI003F8902DA
MNNRYPELAPAQAWQLAYQWLCQRRRHYPANADIWHLRFHWPARSATLFARVMAGHYRLSPMQLLGGHAIWSAEDALVLKWVALRVAPRLPWHPACEHGRGMGVVASRRRLHDFLQGAGGSHPYVLRTDIRGYYQHIDRARVLSRLVAPLPCPVCRELMRQYLYYSVECGGEFHTPSSGISRGCALSPLIGASLLWHIDADFAARGELYYARYMDDFIVLARTRWRLRDAVRRLNGYLAADGFSQHPAKTWIGRLDRGIDWLGGWYTTAGRVGIAPNALQRYRTKSLRLYEQTLRAGNPEAECQRRVRGYLKRWRGSVAFRLAPAGCTTEPGMHQDCSGASRTGQQKPLVLRGMDNTCLGKNTGAKLKGGQMNSNRPLASRIRATLCACIAASQIMGPNQSLAINGPVPKSFEVVSNTCNQWEVKVTYVAAPLSDADKQLGSYHNWTERNHAHYSKGDDHASAYLYWEFHRSDNDGKVAEINQMLFGTEQPPVGAVMARSFSHAGGCANDIGLQECVGILVGPTPYADYYPHQEVPVFPTTSTCFRVPPANGSCYFEVPSASQELGVVGAAGAATDIPLTYTCSGSPPPYRVSMVGGNSGMAVNPSVGRVALTVGGKPLPLGVDASRGAHQINLHAVFEPSSGKTGAFTAVGTIKLELQ